MKLNTHSTMSWRFSDWKPIRKDTWRSIGKPFSSKMFIHSECVVENSENAISAPVQVDGKILGQQADGTNKKQNPGGKWKRPPKNLGNLVLLRPLLCWCSPSCNSGCPHCIEKKKGLLPNQWPRHRVHPTPIGRKTEALYVQGVANLPCLEFEWETCLLIAL